MNTDTYLTVYRLAQGTARLRAAFRPAIMPSRTSALLTVAELRREVLAIIG